MQFPSITQCLNIPPKSHFQSYNFGIFHQFLSCLVTLFDRKLKVFKKSPNLIIFNELLSTQKHKRSSLRSQCWMRLLGRFSNTVILLFSKVVREGVIIPFSPFGIKVFWISLEAAVRWSLDHVLLFNAHPRHKNVKCELRSCRRQSCFS